MLGTSLLGYGKNVVQEVRRPANLAEAIGNQGLNLSRPLPSRGDTTSRAQDRPWLDFPLPAANP